MPLRFEIFRNGKRLDQFMPIAAMAIGPDSVPIPGDVAFTDGHLVVTRPDDHAAGVALLWDVGPIGAFHLETTRLPPRVKPYNLNVELARARLMKIVQKQEDWNLFDFPKAERFIAKFRESQALLAEALGKLDMPDQASVLADQSLASAVDLSEQLALFHCDLLINRRRAANGFVRHVLGCRVDPTIPNTRYRDALAASFDYAVLPITWKQVQPQEQVFETTALDEWVELLTRRRLPIIAGPLIDLSEDGVPDWMYIWEHDFDTMREMAYEYVQKILTRYRKAVSVWNVASGLHLNQVFSLNFEQIIELTRLLVAQVKTLIPNAKTLVTVKQPFGEYHARSRATVAPMAYAEMVAQAGINFDAFGLELEMGVPAPGAFLRDLFQISCMLDRFSTMGRPLFLTAICVPGRPNCDPNDRSEGKLDPSAGGRWRKGWDPDLQAEWLAAVYRMALSKPYVESVAWANLADMNPSLPGGGLLDDMLRPKASFNKLQELREQFHSWGRKA
jgi:hypothetical protein